MLEIRNISKYYDNKQVLKNVSFVAEDGKVTGFVGPNGSGKSTALYCAVGLMKSNNGSGFFDGMPYESLPSPIETVGIVLNTKTEDESISALNHLNAFAAVYKIPKSRVQEVIDMAGLNSAKNVKIGAMSLGMRKRLAIATAILADPHNLILDEPFYGLDQEGIRWVRELCRYYASRGGAVLLSSNSIREVALAADNLVIIAHGDILQRTSVEAFTAAYSQYSAVRVITPDPEKLLNIMQSKYSNCTVTPVPYKTEDVQDGASFVITNVNISELAQYFADQQLVTYQLNRECSSLEDAYMAITNGHTQYVSKPPYIFNKTRDQAALQEQYLHQQANQMQYAQPDRMQYVQQSQNTPQLQHNIQGRAR